MNNHEITQSNKLPCHGNNAKKRRTLRRGYTTGTCAAAAAAGAAQILFSGKEIETVTLTTPDNTTLCLKLLDIIRSDCSVSCGVKKDAGDDSDVTDGIVIYACVCYEDTIQTDDRPTEIIPSITITGGIGIGTVTKEGLEQPVGSPAINSIPRQMITMAVRQAAQEAGVTRDIRVTISAPDGVIAAQKTFNPRLGIIGGISILGTTGIVEPMSEKALLDTIYIELRQHATIHGTTVPLLITPGNYGRDFAFKNYGIDLETGVKCSNFIGDTLDMANDLGFRKLLLIGHIGKLVKCAAGIMNTHSRMADARMEVLCSCALLSGASIDTAKALLDCTTTDEALHLLDTGNILPQTMHTMLDRALSNLRQRAATTSLEMITFSNKYGTLASSDHAMQYVHAIINTDTNA